MFVQVTSMEWLFPGANRPLKAGSMEARLAKSTALFRAAGRYSLAMESSPFFTQDPALMPRGETKLRYHDRPPPVLRPPYHLQAEGMFG
jgi:hypothetical protein